MQLVVGGGWWVVGVECRVSSDAGRRVVGDGWQAVDGVVGGEWRVVSSE